MRITVRKALNQALHDQLQENEKVFLIGEEVAEYNGAYKITQGLLDKFGAKRVIDSPISEYGFTGLATGAAFKGLIPVVEFMSFNFSMQAIDHIINSCAKTSYMSGGRIKSSIVFRGPNGFAKGVAAQHSQAYMNWYASCPGLIVIAPYSAKDCYGLLYSAIECGKPVVFLEQELLYGKEFEVDDLIPLEIGKATILQEGSDLTLVSFSRGIESCERAIEMVKQKNPNISIELIDLRTIKPLDIDTVVNSLKKTNKIMFVEEGFGFCGVCAELIAQVNELAFDYLDYPPIRLTGLDVPMPYARNLEKEAAPNEDSISDRILKIFN